MPGGRQQQHVNDLEPFNFHRRILVEFSVAYETGEILTSWATGVNGATPLFHPSHQKAIA
jgi:hypothetical protein